MTQAGPQRLGETDAPLAAAYDLAMLDLDGVVYVGSHAVPGAAGHLAAARAAGMALAFVTNNASRPPARVAEHLTSIGVPAAPGDVVTAAQAAARLVADRVPAGSRVFVIGGTGLQEALTEQDLISVQSIEEEPVAVVSGYHPDLRWKTVIDGAILVRRGLPWVASNTDLTVPTPHGPGPGNGVLVRAVADFAAVEPEVAGKPQPPLLHETHRRVGGRRPRVGGDRLDTDIEGALRAGYDSLLVMTGVTDLEALVTAPPGRRPTYLAADLGGLLHAQGAPVESGEAWCDEDWAARIDGRRVTVSGSGSVDAWWRVVAAASWAHRDRTGHEVSTASLGAPTAPVVEGELR